MFIIAIVLLAIGVIALIAVPFIRRADGTGIIAGLVGAVAILVGGLFFGLSTYYAQDPGEANVLRTWSGELVGYETEEGGHWKAPWVDTVTFDTRNQRVVYTGGASQGDNSGGSSDGPQVTVQDKDGVSSNVDVTVRYSIDPEAIISIYEDYGNEENLRARLIFNDIRSVVRDVPGAFTTLQLLTQRGDVQAEIFDRLQTRWEGDGVIIEDVSLQEIRPPESVVAAFAAAQEAKTAVETAKANLEKAEVDAQQKVVNAQAEADANSILNASLSGAILQQRYLDTLAKLAQGGNLVVVPDGFNGLVNVSK